MAKLRYSNAALENFQEIADYIARTSASSMVASRFVQQLDDRCRTLASLPGTLGRARPELGAGFRSVAYRNYVIFFRYEEDRLFVINILDGHRDIDTFFEDDV